MNKIKLLLLFIIALLVIVIALSAGNSFISPLRILDLISGNNLQDVDILRSLRIPKVVLALIVGASLSVSGVIFQSILRNPLADPFTIGVSSGAALGATIGIIFHMNSFTISATAFAGSSTAAYFVYLISKQKKFGSSYLILSGISLSFVLTSSVMLIFSLSPAQEVHRAIMWLMGDLSIARFDMLYPMVLLSLTLIGISYLYFRQLNIISFGQEFSRSLGITRSDIRNLFWISSMLAALSVSIAGVIGFVGLIIPHVVRYLFGANHKQLIGLSAFCGGIFLVICDTLSRSIAPPYEIPIGVITGFFGGIFFLILMIRGGTGR